VHVFTLIDDNVLGMKNKFVVYKNQKSQVINK